MLKRFVVGIALCCLGWGAAAQEMRQFFAETATPLHEISDRLRPVLTDTVTMTEQGDTAFVSYTGTRTPPGLQSFLTSAFETLDPGALQQSVAISLVMTGHPDRTDLSLMVRGQFPESGTAVLPGGLIIMDGLGAAPCTGQLIVQHALSPEETVEGYQRTFEAEGYVFEEPLEGELSFFIGSRIGCTVSLYAHGQAGGSTAIIRYLEE